MKSRIEEIIFKLLSGWVIHTPTTTMIREAVTYAYQEGVKDGSKTQEEKEEEKA